MSRVREILESANAPATAINKVIEAEVIANESLDVEIIKWAERIRQMEDNKKLLDDKITEAMTAMNDLINQRNQCLDVKAITDASEE